MRQRLCEALIFTLPEGVEDFVVYSNVPISVLGAVLNQRGRMIIYVSRQLKPYEANYPIHDSELGDVVFPLKL